MKRAADTEEKKIKKTVIIGGVVGGASCAARLRRLQEDAEIRNGTGKEQKVTIIDKIPKYTKYVKGSADNGGIYDEVTRTITWKKTVKDGESFVVIFKVKVDKDVAGESVENETVVKDGQNEDGLVTNETKNPTTPKKDVFAKGDDKSRIFGVVAID